MWGDGTKLDNKERDVTKIHISLQVNEKFFLSDFMKIYTSRRFSKITQINSNIKLETSCSMRTDGRTNG